MSLELEAKQHRQAAGRKTVEKKGVEAILAAINSPQWQSFKEQLEEMLATQQHRACHLTSEQAREPFVLGVMQGKIEVLRTLLDQPMVLARKAEALTHEAKVQRARARSKEAFQLRPQEVKSERHGI